MRHVHTIALALVAAGLAAGSACGQTAFDQFEKKAKAPLTAVPKAAPAAEPAATGAAPASEAPYLGVEADETAVTNRGAIIAKVKKGAPSDLGGLKDGDIITAVDGKVVRNWDEVDAAMKGAKIGSKVVMTIQRGGLQETKTVTLGRKPAATAATADPPATTPEETSPPATSPPTLTPPAGTPPTLTPPAGTPLREPATDPLSRPLRDPDLDLPPPPETDPLAPLTPAAPETDPGAAADPLAPPTAVSGRATLGISVVPLTAETRATYEVRSTARQGAIIHSVRPGSPADLAGLPVGGVIVSIDGLLVKSSDELAAAVASGRPGQEVELRYMLDGDRVATKTVRLAPASAIGAVPASPPAVGGLSDRSNLRRFSDTLESGSTSRLTEIQESIQALTEKISALEERLKLLEGKPGGEAPAVNP